MPGPAVTRCPTLNSAVLSSVHLGHLLLPVTALAAAAGIIAALLLSQRTAPRAGVSADALWSGGLFAVIAAFVCSRLLLILSDLHSFARAPLLLLALPSLTATGVLLSALATTVFLRLRRVPLRRALDAWAAPGALLWFALALGDLLARTDPGLPTQLPWGIRSSSGGAPGHPVALYAAIVAFLLTVAAWHFLGTPRFCAPGVLAALTLVLGGLAQFGLSFLREPLLALYTPTPFVEPLEWLSLIAVVAGAVLYLTRPITTAAPSPASHLVASHAL